MFISMEVASKHVKPWSHLPYPHRFILAFRWCISSMLSHPMLLSIPIARLWCCNPQYLNSSVQKFHQYLHHNFSLIYYQSITIFARSPGILWWEGKCWLIKGSSAWSKGVCGLRRLCLSICWCPRIVDIQPEWASNVVVISRLQGDR